MKVLDAVVSVALAATPVPAEPVDTPPEELITPGTVGFLVTFAVAVALFLLVRDMNRRVQRIQVRGERADAAGRTDGPGSPAAGTPPLEPPPDTPPAADPPPADPPPGDPPAGPRGGPVGR